MDYFREILVLCNWCDHSAAFKYARDLGESNSDTGKDYSFDMVQQILVLKKPEEGGPNFDFDGKKEVLFF